MESGAGHRPGKMRGERLRESPGEEDIFKVVELRHRMMQTEGKRAAVAIKSECVAEMAGEERSSCALELRPRMLVLDNGCIPTGRPKNRARRT